MIFLKNENLHSVILVGHNDNGEKHLSKLTDLQFCGCIVDMYNVLAIQSCVKMLKGKVSTNVYQSFNFKSGLAFKLCQ